MGDRRAMWVSLPVLLLWGCQSTSEPASDAVADAASDVASRDAVADGSGIDPALRRRLFQEVHAYLTAEDPGPNPPLLARLDTVYHDIPFDVVAEAVRQRPPASLPATGVHQHTWTNPHYDGEETYHAYVPPALATAAASAFPLLIFLHGAGGNGASIAQSTAVQQAADGLGAILVAPTSNADCDWSATEDCMSQIVLLVQHLKRRYPVDDARVVLSGFSMGGRGSFSVGVAYPEPYCGLVPVAGSIGAVHNTTDLQVHKAYCCPHVENVQNLRLHYISGELDMELMLYQNRGCELCLKEQGSEHVYTELKGQGHVWPLDLWEQAVAWTLGRPRPAYPDTVIYNLAAQASSVYPDDLWLQQTLRAPQYWADIEARVDETKPARVEAQRTGDVITLVTSNVARVGLYLADGQSEVTVLEDDRVLFAGLVARDRRFLLTEARRRSERSMIFANRLTLYLR
jgi:predicted esterase